MGCENKNQVKFQKQVIREEYGIKDINSKEAKNELVKSLNRNRKNRFRQSTK